MNFYTLDEMTDKHIGRRGTPERDSFEADVEAALIGSPARDEYEPTLKITRIWFDADYIYGVDESGKEYRQSLLWYPNLRNASEKERMNYKLGFSGIHWRGLDEDISFESFSFSDTEPTF